MTDAKARRRHHDPDEVDEGRSAAEERVRVLEQYIKDMSIKNMMRPKEAGIDKKREAELQQEIDESKAELAKKAADMAKLEAVVISQGDELVQMKRRLEDMEKDNRLTLEQLETGCKRLAHHVQRYLSENSKFDLTMSTVSTVSHLSHLSTSSTNTVSSTGADTPKEKEEEEALQAPQEEELGPLRAAETTAYASFPTETTLALDPRMFLHTLRKDLQRLPLPESVQKDQSCWVWRRAGSSENLLNVEVPEQHLGTTDEIWQQAKARLGRIEAEMHELYGKLALMPDVHCTDPVQIIQTTSTALTRMLHDISQIAAPVNDVIREARKVTAEHSTTARRMRQATADFKVKEQRHALKVDLLEKRLERLTSTLTSVQQDVWSSKRPGSSEEPLLCRSNSGNFADQPEEYREFVQLLEEREKGRRRAERQVSLTQGRVASLENQVLELALQKYDAECALVQAKHDNEYLLAQQRRPDKEAATVTPPLPGAGLFEGLFSAPPFAHQTPADEMVFPGLCPAFGVTPPPFFPFYKPL